MAVDSATSLLFAIGANTDDAEANISRFRGLFSASLSDLTTQFHNFAAELTGGGEEINASFTAMASIAAGATVAIGAGLFEMARKTAETGEQLLLLSQQVGLSVEQLSGLKVVAERMGVDFDTLSRGVAIMDRSLSPFASSGATAAKALASIGVTATTAGGQLRDNTAIMADIADKFHGMQDGANKTALAMSIFGRSGMEMIPILDKGGAAIRAAAGEAKKLGLVFTQASAEQSAEFLESMRNVKFAADGLSATLGQQLIPVLLRAMQGTAAFAQSSASDVSQFAQGMGQVLTYVGKAAEVLWDSLEAIGKSIGFLMFATEQAAQAAWDEAHLHFTEARADLVAIGTGAAQTAKDIAASFGNLKSQGSSDIEAIGKAMDALAAKTGATESAASTLEAAYESVKSSVEAMQDAMAKPEAAALAQYQRGLAAADKQLAAYQAQIAAGKKTDETLEQYEQEYYLLRTELAQKYQLTLDQLRSQEAAKAAQHAQQQQQQLEQRAAAATAATNKMWQDQVNAALTAIHQEDAAQLKQVEAAHTLDQAVDTTTQKLETMAQRSTTAAVSASDKIRDAYLQQIQTIHQLVAAETAKGLTQEQSARLAQAAAAAESGAAAEEASALGKLRQQQAMTAAQSVNSFVQMGLAAAGYRNTIVTALMAVIKMLEQELIAHMTSAVGTVAAENIKNAATGQGIGLRSVWHAAEQFAMGLADVASLNFAGAAAHFAAAGAFTSVAASVGTAVASLFAGGAGSSAAKSSTTTAAATTAAAGSASSSGSSPAPIVNVHVDGVISADNLNTIIQNISGAVARGSVSLVSSHKLVGGAVMATG